MENDIKHNYDLNVQSIKFDEEKNMAIITDIEHTYYLVPYTRPVEDMEDIYYVSEELIKKNIASHSFVLNRSGKILTTINNLYYALLKINFLENYEFDLSEILAFNKLTRLNDNKGKLYRNDWASLWSAKVDYFEYQISEIGRGKRIIQNSFSYYVGLAENAIAYVNQTTKNNKDYKAKNIVLCRKRIYYPNIAINYLNPISYIFDLEIRDIAEYIKTLFFNEKDVWDEIDLLFKKEKFDSYMLHMLFARLLYPSYYFDIYEKIMNENYPEEELIPIIKKVDEYEDFLEEMYHYLNDFVSMIPIDWLIKKDQSTGLN